jgi:predicted amidophosphoribosyltransferase
VRAAVAYDPAARAIVVRAKERGCPELYDMMARMVRVAAADRDAETPELVVGVPSHPWHGFRRGFTPGEEMARRLAEEIGRPTIRRLVGRRWLPLATAMKRLSRAARLRAARRAFHVRGRTAQGRRILLVDDVMTTGASLEACAGRLKEAGASHVEAWVWARKL